MRSSESSIEDKISSIKYTLQRMSPTTKRMQVPQIQFDQKPQEPKQLDSEENPLYDLKSKESRRLTIGSRLKDRRIYNDQSYERPLKEVTEILRNKDKLIRELLNELEDSKNQSDKKIISKDFEIKELSDQLYSLQFSYKNEIFEKNREIESREQEINQLKYERSSLKNNLESLENDKSHLKLEKSSLEQIVTDLENDKNLLIHETEKMLEMIESMKDDKINLIAEHKRQIDNYEKKLQESNLREKSLEKNIKHLQESLSSQEIANTELRDQINNLISQHREELNDLYENHRNEVDTMTQHITELKSERHKLNLRIDQLKDLIKDSSEKKYGNDAKEMMYREMEQHWENKLESLEKENKGLRKQLREKENDEIMKKKKKIQGEVTSKFSLATASKLLREIQFELNVTNNNAILASIQALKKGCVNLEIIRKLEDLVSKYFDANSDTLKCVKDVFKAYFQLKNEHEPTHTVIERLKSSLKEPSVEHIPKAVTLVLSENEHLNLLLNKVKTLFSLPPQFTLKDLEEEINNRL